MARPMPRSHKNRIKTHVAAGNLRMTLDKGQGGALDPVALVRGYLGFMRRARLDLDEHDGPATPADEVDLPLRTRKAPRQNPVSLEPQ